jgi:hypothetical protein
LRRASYRWACGDARHRAATDTRSQYVFWKLCRRRDLAEKLAQARKAFWRALTRNEWRKLACNCLLPTANTLTARGEHGRRLLL